VEIDGFKKDENIIIIGATNFFESLDKALLRSGRFDKKIELPVPDRQARAEILEYYLGKIKTDETISLRLLISRSYGMTGADIENLVNLAALHAVQRGEQVASWEDFEYAIDRVTMGIGHKSLAVSEVDIQNTVYHELGHATVAFYTEGANELQKITILPRGQSLGHTAFVLHKEDAPFTKQEVLAQIDVCMGGRAAEEVFFGEKNITTGCSNDLKNATSLAYSGLSAGLFNEITGLGSFKELEDLGSHQRNELDKAVFEILTSSYNRALRVIREKVSVIHTLAKELRAKETLSKDQFIEIIEKSKLA
jgi:ATP-dependent metalloprotease